MIKLDALFFHIHLKYRRDRSIQANGHCSFSIHNLDKWTSRVEIPSRQALVKYVLQRYQIDPKNLDPKPEAQQVVIANLNALKPWLYD